MLLTNRLLDYVTTKFPLKLARSLCLLRRREFQTSLFHPAARYCRKTREAIQTCTDFITSNIINYLKRQLCMPPNREIKLAGIIPLSKGMLCLAMSNVGSSCSNLTFLTLSSLLRNSVAQNVSVKSHNAQNPRQRLTVFLKQMRPLPVRSTHTALPHRAVGFACCGKITCRCFHVWCHQTLFFH